jgi:antitoxin VapB
MATTRVFQSGNSRAVRIPRDIELPLGEVEIFSRGDEVVIRRRRDTLADIPDLLASFPDDFLPEGCSDSPPQRRRGL